jgi:hypothetical protein
MDYYHRVDTDAGGLLVPYQSISSSFSTHMIYKIYLLLKFTALNNVIITIMKVSSSHVGGCQVHTSYIYKLGKSHDVRVTLK